MSKRSSRVRARRPISGVMPILGAGLVPGYDLAGVYRDYLRLAR